MEELNKPVSLPKDVSSRDDLDFGFLREKGRQYIEQLAGDLWTDYNAHDPGITILEMLCYAITDLGARMQMPVEDLLSSEEDTGGNLKEQFFTAPEILPSHPVTEEDYRKLFIDIKGVKNCWLKPFKKTVHVDCKNGRLSYDADDFSGIHPDLRKAFQLSGLYSVIVDFDRFDKTAFPDKASQEAEKNRIKEEIRKRYHANRNLCEDLAEINETGEHPIAVCGRIELFPEVDEELVYARILRAVDHYFSPSLKFYSLRQMLDRGYSTDKIFEGPLLNNGFPDPAELAGARLRSEVRLSDLIQLISSIDGVKVIREMMIKDPQETPEESDNWLLRIKEGCKPVRCEKSVFSFFKGVLPVNISRSRTDHFYRKLEEAEKEIRKAAKTGMEPEIPRGEYRGIRETTTIQNDFPDVYGTGPAGLPLQAGPERRSKAKQLKGYLLFFDQILAGYFAHLEKVKDLLSVNNQVTKTYFTQAVEDLSGLEELIPSYPEGDPDGLADWLFADLDHVEDRKNKILDHLIARFSEKFSDYAFLMKQLYGEASGQAVLSAKQSFLGDYEVTSGERGRGFNYFGQTEAGLWHTDNVAGVQKRIARLAGIRDFRRRDVPDAFVEMYHFTDTDGRKVFRWRIRDTKNAIILSATENYGSAGMAENELYLSVLKMIHTTPETIRKAFEATVEDHSEVGNIGIRISGSGKYSFNVINREAPPDSAERIIARHYSYYNTQEELKEVILNIHHFFTEDFNEEAMFMVEHILLRPDVTKSSPPSDLFMPVCADDCAGCNPVDPYSYRMTVVLPGFAFRFANPDFRRYLEAQIRKEIPAHILARICWAGDRESKVPGEDNDIRLFQKAYHAFLLSLSDPDQEQQKEELISLINTLNRLNSIYPPGRLISCEEEDEDLTGRVILGRTNIGNL